MRAPTSIDRYAVVIPGLYGPSVSFWESSDSVIRLLARYCGIEFDIPVSVWRHDGERDQWRCIFSGDADVRFRKAAPGGA